MKIIELDLTGCKTPFDLHERIRVAFDFPTWYGKNWDAFWDCLNTDCNVAFISVVGSNAVADELKGTVKVVLEMLEENKQDWASSDCPFDYEVVS
ncbi:MAG: hypothetical protein E7552_02770 [Ruminococcaceae bacterium]|nr:hypothetical protein [Oscillospiraceae bacterium]